MKKIIDKATDMEHRSIELIQTKLSCARDAIANPPKGMKPEEIVLYTKGCIDAMSEYQWLEKLFWRDAFKAHKFTDETVSIDLNTGEFYIEEKDEEESTK